MGRGNVNVYGEYEGLFYVDCDYLYCYISNEADEEGEYDIKYLGEMTSKDFDSYEYCYDVTQENIEWFIREFSSEMKKRFDSFVSTGESDTILENSLFEIKLEDNEWSIAVELIQVEDDYYGAYTGLQKKHYKSYLEGMKNILLNMFPQIGCYGGCWTYGTIKRED